MSWRVAWRPRVDRDIEKASRWYEGQRPGLGSEFVSAIIEVFNSLGENPFLNASHGPDSEVRWRLPRRFPYRVIYQIREEERLVLVVAVIHSARHDRHWQRRL